MYDGSSEVRGIVSWVVRREFMEIKEILKYTLRMGKTWRKEKSRCSSGLDARKGDNFEASSIADILTNITFFYSS